MSLKLYLLIRILTCGVIGALLALFFVLNSHHQRFTLELGDALSAMERILELQLVGPMQGLVLSPRFPDWYPAMQVARPAGSCARLFRAGNVIRSECLGRGADFKPPPVWFKRLYGAAVGTAETRSVVVEGGSGDIRLELSPDAEIELQQAWQTTLNFMLPAGGLLALVCVALWWTINRAVRPVGDILQQLSAIEAGNLLTSPAQSPVKEFAHIADACEMLGQSLRRGREERAQLMRRLLSVQDNERIAFARELHDEFGQHLSAISANTAALDSSIVAGRNELERIDLSVRHLLTLLRDVLARMRPCTDHDGSISDALGALVQAFRSSHGTAVKIELEVMPAQLHLSDELTSNCYRIVQEALTNCFRHASAQSIRIVVRAQANSLELSVTDDGAGCDTRVPKTGRGLEGMRERCAIFAGDFQFQSTPGQGSSVVVSLPLGTTD